MAFNPVFDIEGNIARKDYTAVYQSLMLIKDFHMIFDKGRVDEVTAYQMFQHFSNEGLDLNVQDRHGKTFLMYACDNDYRGIILHLCKHNANMELTDSEGHTAFDLVNNKSFTVENYKIKDILRQYYKPQKRDVAPRPRPVQTPIDDSVFFKEKCRRDPAEGLPIFFYDYYETSSSGRANTFSRFIWAFKDKRPGAIDAVTRIFVKVFNTDFTITCVPSSTVGNASALPQVIKRLPQGYNIIDATSCLERVQSIQSAHRGGARSYRLHRMTIQLRNKALIEGKDVLLFDDIVTTGNSMLACYDILRQANPKSIVCFCLGRTPYRRVNW